jgi:hypothetical protein
MQGDVQTAANQETYKEPRPTGVTGRTDKSREARADAGWEAKTIDTPLRADTLAISLAN